MTTQTDQTEITALVDRFFRALDAREFTPGWVDGFLTPDARMKTPLGTAEGAAAVRATEEALGRYDRTQHLASGVVADTDEGTDGAAGTARASWNALMVHVHHDATLFQVGGVFEAELTRTGDGWRFARMAVRAVWTQGRPPAGVARTPARQPSAPRVG
ncbi:nuclear transport factor 2 family protein [Streptomyces murinus]|uniref:nuclear transport factor 2 family protein n=1 Tax=Streptomyces murinus TaxID=33900 RepID=UPI002E0E88FB|nr:nuclear transport factor 2 family protein [Streptomyces murinus]